MDVDNWLPSWLAALLPRRRQLKVAVARERGKNRSGTFTVITFAAAATSFMLALFGVGPFAVQALVVSFSSGQIPASQVFPAVSPTHQTVIVYDPPKSTPPPSNPRPAPSPKPTSQPPQESPEPGDN